jgi:cysteine sulfinate desulfinase/cysteine desulfurase-like protein
LIVGLGKACEISMLLDYASVTSENWFRIQRLENNILTKFSGAYILVSSIHRIPNILNVVIPGLEVEKLISDSGKFSFSNGSACDSHIIKNSHVVAEILDNDVVFSFRLSFSKIPLFSDDVLSDFNLLLESNIFNYA